MTGYAFGGAGPSVHADNSVPVSAGPFPEYAVPSEFEDAPYADTIGWAPGISVDRARLGEPRPDFRPTPNKPPGRWWQRNSDTIARHSVEEQDADGWEENKGGSGKPTAPDPRRNPPPETRLTQAMAPRTYSFFRPWDNTSARLLNGTHFSMADHRREYEILGMAPVRNARNTYRIEPTPWDANMVDTPVDVEPSGPRNGRVAAVNLPPSQNRSGRLM